MSSRFGRNDNARNALFSNYDAQTQPSKSRNSPAPGNRSSSRNAPLPYSSSPYGFSGSSEQNGTLGAFGPQQGGGFAAYPDGGEDVGGGVGGGGFRSATPNRKGQYSDSVMESLESQNEEQAGEMSRKVRMLKDLTMAIGDEIRDSTAFAEKMNDSFEGTSNRLRGTMNRMLRMAERTGVGWRIWVGFFLFVFGLFAYVWLF